jgi:hypothetical protein
MKLTAGKSRESMWIYFDTCGWKSTRMYMNRVWRQQAKQGIIMTVPGYMMVTSKEHTLLLHDGGAEGSKKTVMGCDVEKGSGWTSSYDL